MKIKYQSVFHRVDESVLTLLSKRNSAVNTTIYTANISNQFKLDIKRHNAQYPKIEVKQFTKAHDRFLIIDSKTVYHIGASLKDLGKKPVVSEVESMVRLPAGRQAFSKIKLDANELINKLSSNTSNG